jgi:hypothetical protein
MAPDACGQPWPVKMTAASHAIKRQAVLSHISGPVEIEKSTEDFQMHNEHQLSHWSAQKGVVIDLHQIL